jgi:LysR family transcriptional regulator (chromosome initiation inhibitor)
MLIKAMLDYKLVEALALVVVEGGFEKAGRALHLTQSAVSQRVRLLEEQVGQVLLARTNPPRPTGAGRGLVRHYLQVKRLEEDLAPRLFPKDEHGFTNLILGVNADSLATWLFPAVGEFLIRERVTLDLRLDDQVETHKLLRDGEVAGSISGRDEPIQGCSTTYLGRMDYGLFASAQFIDQWLPKGLTLEAARSAPQIIFNRKDNLHSALLQRILHSVPEGCPTHYAPSSELFPALIARGVGYGALPVEQARDLETQGLVANLAPGVCEPVRLYWRRWNIASSLLERFSAVLASRARELLQQE